jgi:uncharacterized protein involved in exopolysaccharide biosynthesis
VVNVSESSQPYGSAPEPSGEISLADIVQFFRRNWLLIGGTALLLGVLAAIAFSLSRPQYEATATLVIVPPKFSSELKPGTLNVQSYQKILESDAVLGETKRRLVERGVLEATRTLRLGQNLETRIFVARRAEEISLAPMLQTVARGETAEQAAAIANTWADVFLARTRELIAGSTSSSVQFIDQEYPQVRESLNKLEDTRVGLANDLQLRYDRAASSWDGKVSSFKNETIALVAMYQAETRRLVEEFSSQHNQDSRRAQLDALRKAYTDLQGEQARVSSLLQLKILQLDSARKQLADTAPVLNLQKAAADEAILQSGSSSKDGKPDWKALQKQSLNTQEVNPVHTDLNLKVATTEMEVQGLTPRAATLTADLERLNTEMKDLEAKIRADDANLEKLQREREAGLAQLQETRTAKLADVQRARQEELDALKREMDTRLAQLDRDLGQQRDLFGQLAKNYNQALLAKGQQDVEDVRIGAPAVPPQSAQPRGRINKTLFAVMIGGFLGIVLALVREAGRSVRIAA